MSAIDTTLNIAANAFNIEGFDYIVVLHGDKHGHYPIACFTLQEAKQVAAAWASYRGVTGATIVQKVAE